MVKAQTVPTFPQCTSPQGNVRVSYTEGTHGIVGKTGSYQGADTVYRLSDETLAQCFCDDNGSGIQTDWWKVSSLTQTQIQTLRQDGWSYVPNGALWGLDEAPYLAKNKDYTCSGRGGVLGSQDVWWGGQVLGLADTGGMLSIAKFVTLGTILVLLGWKYRSKKMTND